MDVVIAQAKLLRTGAALIALTLLLCGAVLLKEEHSLAVQLLAGLALTLAVPLAYIFGRLSGLVAGDRRATRLFATGGQIGKNMAQIRWDLIDSHSLFCYGEFEEAGKKMRKVSKLCEKVAHDCWWLDSHGGNENEA